MELDQNHTVFAEGGFATAASSLSRATEFSGATDLGDLILSLGLRCRCLIGIFLSILGDIEFDSPPLTFAQRVHPKCNFALHNPSRALADTSLQIILTDQASETLS